MIEYNAFTIEYQDWSNEGLSANFEEEICAAGDAPLGVMCLAADEQINNWLNESLRAC